MKIEGTTEEQGGFPSPPASDYCSIVHPPRSTDNGDEKDMLPPRHSSMPAADVMGETGTARRTLPLSLMSIAHAAPPKVAPHSKMNRRKERKGGLRNNLLPGAVAVQGIATPSGRHSTPQSAEQFTSGSDIAEPNTQSEPRIVAYLAPDFDDKELEAKVAQQAKEVWRLQMENIILADEVNQDESQSYCDLKTRTLILLGILAVLIIIGGIVGGVASSRTGAITPSAPAWVGILSWRNSYS